MSNLFENRFNKIRKEMKNKSIDALLITDPDSIWYLTGIRIEPYERLFALYLESKNEQNTKLFLNKLFNVGETNLNKIIFTDNDDYLKILSENILQTGILGVDKNIPAKFLLPLMDFNKNVKFNLGSESVDLVRGIKDKHEIELMKETSKINDECMTAAISYIKPNITEIQLANYIDSLFAKHNAVPSFETTVCFGKNAADPHHVSDNTMIMKGDLVLIDMGCKKNNYCSDMTRTVFFQTTPTEMAKIHEIVRKANEAAENAIKPGVPLSVIDEVARNFIREAGYGQFFTHRLGHFIGQTAHEDGEVSKLSKLIASEGMIFSIEPGIYIQGKGGVRIEDLVLVTKDGCEVLNNVDKKWHVVGL